jgi:DNA-binding MarR family transcriptional regulator
MAKGLVTQIDDPTDGRVRLISKSPVGQRKSQQIEDFYRDIHRKILLEFDDEERRNVLSHLELLRSAMEAVKEQLI